MLFQSTNLDDSSDDGDQNISKVKITQLYLWTRLLNHKEMVDFDNFCSNDSKITTKGGTLLL